MPDLITCRTCDRLYPVNESHRCDTLAAIRDDLAHLADVWINDDHHMNYAALYHRLASIVGYPAPRD